MKRPEISIDHGLGVYPFSKMIAFFLELPLERSFLFKMMNPPLVIPAEAGIHSFLWLVLDSRLHGNDKMEKFSKN
ncbi:MAG: hypothetical protein KG012_07125 [Deltaproteobacteria bacterium]|nr:hypothetical protein [Deltaproteobacteria bacterium]